MENMTFEELVDINCFSENKLEKEKAADLLEKYYCCEIYCEDMDKSVIFAHHARGCTIIAAKICKNVVIFQNSTIGSNMKYNKVTNEWENVGNPILADNVIVADGAKILGPIVIGENTVIGAGAIITKSIPANSIAYGVNKYKPKDNDYDLIINRDIIDSKKIIETNNKLIAEFNKNN